MCNNYLKRPLVSEVTFTVGKDLVRIDSPHTIFISARRNVSCSKDTLLQLYNEVYAKDKKDGIRISYGYHMRSTIKKRCAEYESACQTADALFANIVRQVEIEQA